MGAWGIPSSTGRPAVLWIPGTETTMDAKDTQVNLDLVY